MILYSTNNKDLRVPFKEGVFNSLPADKGLYMPVSIPVLDPEFIADLHKYSLPEIAFRVSKAILNNAIPESDLKAIIDEAINFEAPVIEISKGINVLELFHGPSLAFKDFGARFMSRVMSYFLKEGEKQLDVLVATSGDTGGAVALGFLGVPNVRVTILFPKGKVSPIQELQLTTNGQNIRAIEIDGTFDDCQALVKQAFNDPELKEKFRLTSANSINISRLIPQTFYYFNAYAQIQRMGYKEVVFSVPSGNFGNIGAGLLAWKMGLPVKQFLAATNSNDTVPEFLQTGVYKAKPSVQTWSNAMDVGDPSNWVRIMDMFGGDRDLLKKVITAYSYSDGETLEAIKQVHAENGYIMCPHTAIAWLALKGWMTEHPSDDVAGVFLSTAHPCKFPDIFPAEIAAEIDIPVQVKELEGKERISSSLGNDFEGFKAFLLG
ncbi:MAG: threonine synthase [Sphingobacteriales bacterium 17-39-43]|jgi:threonine synthase|uniref:threonine synthase n=1 Tax=Daejeonella sp. TaxID=2805397 RepID=UPI000BD4C15A|nr:threonine synthase [Daejeonella sp.]OYX95223.1 MAG: threonine synthase [Sphingobacteriia bacterium 35-40-5]OYZ31735.1 MAG: threonine synthase [Sphingobacteriales bacterium 16-39-50]OYZ60613.1 MAG: threonine synthase [Sphingobacteriales bacterium 24-40-4]OZA25132.1 MAG: threonine synthase [Sphingobacteriales bacterium 17-39-43]HQS04036.1 threonine synthase [Daejeonella sp.]